MRQVEFLGRRGQLRKSWNPKNRFCQSLILMVGKVQRRTRRKGVRAMSGRPMRVQAHAAQESRRHHRGISRRPAGGE